MASGQLVAVVGASLGGLAAANVFVQLGYTVHVYERSDSTFENRGSGLGFVDVDVWQRLRGVRMMRRGTQASRQQGAFYYGDLWKFLYEGLPEGTVRFGQAVADLGDNPNRPRIGGEVYDLVVVADGGFSTLRHYVTSTQPQYAGYVVWRGMVDAREVPGFNSFGIQKNWHFDTIVMPLAFDDGQHNIVCGAFVAQPESEVTRPEAGTARHGTIEEKTRHNAPVPDWFLPLYRQNFGRHSGGQLADLFEVVVAKGELKQHPQYEYRADKVTSGRIVLVGDAAHMASPRTAVGAHTAVLDAMSLRKAFSAVPPGDIDAALKLYGPDGIERALQLFMRSQQVSREFVPRGSS